MCPARLNVRFRNLALTKGLEKAEKRTKKNGEKTWAYIARGDRKRASLIREGTRVENIPITIKSKIWACGCHTITEEQSDQYNGSSELVVVTMDQVERRIRFTEASSSHGGAGGEMIRFSEASNRHGGSGGETN